MFVDALDGREIKRAADGWIVPGIDGGCDDCEILRRKFDCIVSAQHFKAALQDVVGSGSLARIALENAAKHLTGAILALKPIYAVGENRVVLTLFFRCLVRYDVDCLLTVDALVLTADEGRVKLR